jgi:hypothetical protein
LDILPWVDNTTAYYPLCEVMTMQLFDTVEVTCDVPEEGVRKGMIGAIVEVFEVPTPAFEVEFTDSDGRTVVLATLPGSQLKKIG